MGVMVVDALIDYVNGEDVPPERLIPTGMYDRAAAIKDPSLR